MMTRNTLALLSCMLTLHVGEAILGRAWTKSQTDWHKAQLALLTKAQLMMSFNSREGAKVAYYKRNKTGRDKICLATMGSNDEEEDISNGRRKLNVVNVMNDPTATDKIRVRNIIFIDDGGINNKLTEQNEKLTEQNEKLTKENNELKKLLESMKKIKFKKGNFLNASKTGLITGYFESYKVADRLKPSGFKITLDEKSKYSGNAHVTTVSFEDVPKYCDVRPTFVALAKQWFGYDEVERTSLRPEEMTFVTRENASKPGPQWTDYDNKALVTDEPVTQAGPGVAAALGEKKNGFFTRRRVSFPQHNAQQQGELRAETPKANTIELEEEADREMNVLTPSKPTQDGTKLLLADGANFQSAGGENVAPPVSTLRLSGSRSSYGGPKTHSQTMNAVIDAEDSLPAGNNMTNGDTAPQAKPSDIRRRRRRLAHMRRRRTLMDRLHRGNVPVRR